MADSIMRLTEEQKNAIEEEGNISLVACPGSGKTRTLISKAARCIRDVFGTPRKIACITYTNSAANEVRSRLSLKGISHVDDYCDVSTIHAFCLNNVLRYFYWMIPHYHDGYMVLPPDSDDFKEIANSLIREYSLDRRHAPGQFELMNREIDGEPIVGWPLIPEVALQFWDILQEQGYIDFPNIVYWSFKLLRDNPYISNALASKYAWILIDEFQDTTSLQVEIFSDLLTYGKTNYFIVGDPNQSIYRFAGARVELFEVFENKIGAVRHYLTGNWRSGPAIIADADKLLPRENPMRAVGKFRDSNTKTSYYHSDSVFSGIIDHFIPALDEYSISYGNSAILAPWWIPLLHLGRALREYGVPIVGPGARPYKRIHLIAPLIEECGAFLADSTITRIPNIERELYFLLNNINDQSSSRIFSYDGRKVVYEILRASSKLQDQCQSSGKVWLTEMGTILPRILHKHGFLGESDYEAFAESSEQILEDMSRNDVDIENISVEELGLFARPNDSVRLLTMHKAKGLEFEAVALIDLHNGRLPHFSAKTNEDREDSRRLFYVAITRAERLLMYFTDQSDWRNHPTPFLCSEGLELA